VTALVAFVLIGSGALVADTLHLRDGRQVNGRLLSVRGDSIEFEEEGGRAGRRVLEFDRDEVRAIEFDQPGWRSGGARGGDDAAGDRPRGLREREVVVLANQPWSDSGIDVRAGQTVYFASQGRVRWGKDRRDGPEGEKNSPYNAARPMPNRPGAALIAKVGEDGVPFFIGSDEGGIRVRASGRLLLGINDDYLADNSGNFRVIVYF
jgi:hypothetical protein